MFKYAFIGAGPATLSAVSDLSEVHRESTVIVEQGHGPNRPICPALKSKSCSSCFGDLCHVTSGVGGASASFGNKLCHFPASDGVKELIPAFHQYEFLNRELSKKDSAVIAYPNVPNRKTYNTNIAYKDDYTRRLESLISNAENNAEVVHSFKVKTINKISENHFHILSNDGAVLDTENVIIATGRSGHKDLRRWLSGLDIDYQENSPDIGIRLEVPTSELSEKFLYQNDPKFKFEFDGGLSARTFCTCIGGLIVPVKFGDGFFADGAFSRVDTGRTNIALMARTGDLFDPVELERWCHSINRAKNNVLELGSFDAKGMVGADIVQSIMDLVPDGPRVGYKIAIELMLSELVNNHLYEMFGSTKTVNGSVKIYGPSIDLYWPKVKLSKGFMTSVDGIYVIGDAAGYSRGIVQSIASGRSWAKSSIASDNVVNTA
ncbi:hypothetical protein [uncultured Cohaesibacter sp.]|uniref:hypothetical protein n=1 Tax=uncultured Cohaesibacter sp. TaxID=1002546 RepID=UPI002AA6D603|nr:hypothetical protein [uncultured Cohaesibacter sp.]